MASVTIKFVLNNGLSCNDFDHCFTTQLCSFLTSAFTFDQRFTVNITLLSQHLLKIHKQVADQAECEGKPVWTSKMRDSPHGAQAFKHARYAFSPPLTALQHDDGRMIIAPASMDELMRTKSAEGYEAIHTIMALTSSATL